MASCKNKIVSQVHSCISGKNMFYKVDRIVADKKGSNFNLQAAAFLNGASLQMLRFAYPCCLYDKLFCRAAVHKAGMSVNNYIVANLKRHANGLSSIPVISNTLLLVWRRGKNDLLFAWLWRIERDVRGAGKRSSC